MIQNINQSKVESCVKTKQLVLNFSFTLTLDECNHLGNYIITYKQFGNRSVIQLIITSFNIG